MNDEVQLYIPQRPPFVMATALIAVDDRMARTSFTIPADNLFVTNGYFTESGMIENMAQTAGSSVGYKSNKAGKLTPIGFFAALKNIHITSLPKAGDTIITEIEFQQTMLNFHIITGKITLNGTEIANGEFKIFEIPEAASQSNS